MVEPISTGIVIAISLLVKSAPSWLPVISDTVLSPARDAFIGKLVEKGFDKGYEGGRKLLRLDEKDQQRHLELALKNAAERGMAHLYTREEQILYSDVLTVLASDSFHSETLRREAMRLFTLEMPDLAILNTLYNDALRARFQGQATADVDAVSYLSSFFEALITELYIDPLFHDRVSDALQARAARGMQRSLTEVVETLSQIYMELADKYTTEQFEKDIKAYSEHIERTLRYLRLVGVVPKERTHENRDPELDGIFVPLRITTERQGVPGTKTLDSILNALVQDACTMLLGGPGSGKTTATRHLTWSHAVANLSDSKTLTNAPLLPGKPLPLRIELRRLNEDRRQRPDYDFLTYASEVLLGRAGLDIPPQMFELLLERRTMLVLFDGLDEVATLDERRRLVDEIEAFAQHYPGNRFLVTSRPVGYELAPLSGQVFAHAQIQPFDDQQIRNFLENWYAHVLRLSPLSSNDQQELEEIYTTLKENPRLHSLAENPLLLTVITALHRYERLPDKRILVYDRCADLLLETWARLKGTKARWQDLKLSKEDQYACVAHLGFVLHERAQEQTADARNTPVSTAVDVPTRFMLREIERFLLKQNFFTSKAEQNVQAKRFLNLIQEEAGLIVERGTDENGESLYGFVHRTFQEYFAGADIYERYQQEEDASIISDFLKKHLHDPHWSEVILLLFGKLKRKPATAQLRQILEGNIQSRRSKYTDIVQQDLIFVSSCLVEEIPVENDLAEAVVSQLGYLVADSPFRSQRSEAIKALGELMQTRQYGLLARQKLKALIAQGQVADILPIIDFAVTLAKNSAPASEGYQAATQMLLELAQRSDLSIKQTIQAAQNLYRSNSPDSEEWRFAAQMLLELAQRSDLAVAPFIQAAQFLYQSSSPNSQERRFATQLFLELTQRSDLSIEQTIQTAASLYQSSQRGSEERRFATQLLLELTHPRDAQRDQLKEREKKKSSLEAAARKKGRKAQIDGCQYKRIAW